MKLKEKLISENHRDEFSATSGRPSISPSPLRLTSMHFPDVIPASEKNPTRQCSRDCAPVIEIPKIRHLIINYLEQEEDHQQGGSIDHVENDLKTLNIKNWQRVAAYHWNWRKRAVEAAKTCNRCEPPISNEEMGTEEIQSQK
ncbi:hypothetical protein TNCV_4774631 [Trichonephila clavipes]|uniref:Uncharacterized protein n=1 Tax=Trichonephila clavipes TaxID=2585209 RepID=A0A8X6UZ75_TRICX|nr:hypothetical protein TNCV_4774631 [Trichonephila clavipes]